MRIVILCVLLALVAGCERPRAAVDAALDQRVNACLRHGKLYHEGIALRCGLSRD